MIIKLFPILRMGEFESGLTAALLGVVPALLIGGVGTILVAIIWMRLFPQLVQTDSLKSWWDEYGDSAGKEKFLPLFFNPAVFSGKAYGTELLRQPGGDFKHGDRDK